MSSTELTMWRVFFTVQAEKADAAAEAAKDELETDRLRQWVNSSE